MIETAAIGRQRAHVIVLGNSKGGTGKSTTAMHLAVGLLREGHRVGTLDLDAQQGTLTRYIESRRALSERRGLALCQPVHRAVEAGDGAQVDDALSALAAGCDYVVIDTPAGESALSLGGHARADTLITPLNDSFVDLDVLARIDPDTHRILRPSRYAATVWEMKKERARRDGRSIDWVVLRNRLANLDAHNKRAMAETLAALGKRIGFRVAPGLSERVIYRELFLLGLTLLDLRDGETGVHLSLSHIAARRELRDLLDALDLARRPRRPAARAEGADPAAPAA